MCRKRRRILLSLILLIVQLMMCLPFHYYAQEQSTTNDMQLSEIEKTESIPKLSEPLLSSDLEEPPINQENVPEEPVSDTQNIQTKRETRASDLSKFFKVTDWEILDSKGSPLSKSNPAISNTNYDFNFSWDLQMQSGKILPGDIVEIPFLRNEEWGQEEWRARPSEVATFSAEVDGQVKELGTWKMDYINGEMKFFMEFGPAVATLDIHQITGVKFSLANKSLSNYTSKGGIQYVNFGGIRKEILFEQAKLSASGGFDFKTDIGSGSNNSLRYAIAVNYAGALELSGDKVDYKINKNDGFFRNPANQPHRWGENFTDVTSNEQPTNTVFVKDRLDEGVGISQLNITARIQTPAGLQAGGLDDCRSGAPSSSTSFANRVLADNGNGPLYRTGSGTTEDKRRPTEENSFKLLKQSAGETEAQFETRIKENAYQYGIYETVTPQNPPKVTRTIMVNFGRMSKVNGEQKKFSDLTDIKDSGKPKIKKLDDNGGQHSDIYVPTFAVEAADDAINKNFYPESERENLEAYFTLAYGDSNKVGGQIPHYWIEMNLIYPPETPSGTKSNTAYSYYRTSLSTVNSVYPTPHSRTQELNNPYGSVVLNSNQAILWKVDHDTMQPMDKVKFKLQKKEGATWQDVSGQTELITGKIIDTSGYELAGGIKVTNLANGTYRFVETQTPEGYTDSLSVNWDGTQVVSAEFTIGGGKGQIVTVSNKKTPTYPYKVEHWLQNEGTDGKDPSHYSKKLTDYYTGEEGKEVTALQKSFPEYRHDANLSFNVKTGVINKNGTLTLKLYYVIDKDSIPFTFYKLDADRNPMPSIGEKKVTFDVYKYMGNWTEEPNAHPEWGPLSGATNGDGSPRWKYKTTIDTDEHGRIRDKTLLSYESYAFVEVENTYPNYTMPEGNEVWWFVNGNQASGFHVFYAMGATNPGRSKYKVGEKEFWAMHNNDSVKLRIYKYDENNQPMPSFDQDGNPLPEDKKVTFILWKYTGNWSTEQNPEKFGPAYKDFWEKKGEYTTDKDGKISTGNYEFEKGKRYALTEKQTYEGYQCPTANQAYWSLGFNDGGFLDWIRNDGTANPGSGKDSTTGDFHIKNRRGNEEARLYKSDSKTGLVMPTDTNDETKQVHFKIYKYTGSWGNDSPDNHPDLQNTTKWKPVINPNYSGDDPSEQKFIFETGEDGRIKDFTQIIENMTYAIQEVKTYEGYEMAESEEGSNRKDAFWRVDVNKSLVIAGVRYIKTATSPIETPIVEPSEPNNSTPGFYQLQNKPKVTFEFIKENEKQIAMKDVSFALYKRKADAESLDSLWSGAINNSNDPNTNWQLQSPYLESISDRNGRVYLSGLDTGYYLLVETKTNAGYELPQGNWIIKISGKDPIIEIKGRGDPLPPAFRVEGQGTDARYFLPNYRGKKLPHAGGYGKIIGLVIGILLIGLAILLVKRPLNKQAR